MALRYNPPPGWPVPADGWKPPLDWHPAPDWPPAPDGWKFWVEDVDPPAPAVWLMSEAAPEPALSAEQAVWVRRVIDAETIPAGISLTDSLFVDRASTQSEPARPVDPEQPADPEQPSDPKQAALRYAAAVVVVGLIIVGAVSSLRESPDQGRAAVALTGASSTATRSATPAPTTSPTPTRTALKVKKRSTDQTKTSARIVVQAPVRKTATATRTTKPTATPTAKPTGPPSMADFCKSVDLTKQPWWIQQMCKHPHRHRHP